MDSDGMNARVNRFFKSLSSSDIAFANENQITEFTGFIGLFSDM